jgi:hypothetical protein
MYPEAPVTRHFSGGDIQLSVTRRQRGRRRRGSVSACLRQLVGVAQRLGPRLVAGYVLYTGQQTLPFGDRLRALLIDALWNSEP